MRLAIFVPNWIGDVVMATPALRALRAHYRDAQLVGVMRPYVSQVLAGLPWFDEQLIYDPRSREPALGSAALIAALRRQPLDAAVLLTHSLRTAVIAWRGGARQRIGFSMHGRGWLLTKRLQPRRHWFKLLPSSALDSYLAIAEAAGCLPESRQMELRTLPEDERAADAAWQRLALPPGEQVVILNSSGAYGAAKLWPPEYFAALARRLAIERQLHVLVLCGPQERAVAAQIASWAAHPAVKSLAGEPLSIGFSKACIRRSRLMVTTDSGPRHMATAFNVPVVSLFGPTHQAWSETYFERETKLQHQVPCGPCSRRVCPLKHHRCMRELSVDLVYSAVCQQLDAYEAAANVPPRGAIKTA